MNGGHEFVFSEDFFRKIFKDIEESSLKRDKTLWCLTRDVFQTRVDEYARESKNYLGAAVVGEIGNNTFDHNWNFVARYPRGTYLKFERQQNMVILADFGRGVRESLKVVLTQGMTRMQSRLPLLNVFQDGQQNKEVMV